MNADSEFRLKVNRSGQRRLPAQHLGGRCKGNVCCWSCAARQARMEATVAGAPVYGSSQDSHHLPPPPVRRPHALQPTTSITTTVQHLTRRNTRITTTGSITGTTSITTSVTGITSPARRARGPPPPFPLEGHAAPARAFFEKRIERLVPPRLPLLPKPSAYMYNVLKHV